MNVNRIVTTGEFAASQSGLVEGGAGPPGTPRAGPRVAGTMRGRGRAPEPPAAGPARRPGETGPSADGEEAAAADLPAGGAGLAWPARAPGGAGPTPTSACSEGSGSFPLRPGAHERCWGETSSVTGGGGAVVPRC